MAAYLLIVVAVTVILAAVIALSWHPIETMWRRAKFAEARRDFHRQRERLEAKFVQLGSVQTKPDSPRWLDCEFDDDVAYARSRSTGQLSAFVAVVIQVQESSGGFSSSGEGSYRAATAVFRFDGHRWETDGRAIFNLTPTEAIHFYQRDLEMVGQELAGHS
jgi:Tfp pilus assembly protein PilE